MIVDGWMNTSKTHLGGIICKVGDGFFPIKIELADSEHHGIAIAHGWEKLLHGCKETYSALSTSDRTFCFNYFLSDNAGQCGCTHCIMALCHPMMIWMWCWAHQINLMVDKLLKLDPFKVQKSKLLWHPASWTFPVASGNQNSLQKSRAFMGQQYPQSSTLLVIPVGIHPRCVLHHSCISVQHSSCSSVDMKQWLVFLMPLLFGCKRISGMQ